MRYVPELELHQTELELDDFVQDGRLDGMPMSLTAREYALLRTFATYVRSRKAPSAKETAALFLAYQVRAG